METLQVSRETGEVELHDSALPLTIVVRIVTWDI
jgi:hypothetical protein